MKTLSPLYSIRVFENGWLLCGTELCEQHSACKPRHTHGIPTSALNDSLPLFPKNAVVCPSIARHYKLFCNFDAVAAVGSPQSIKLWGEQIAEAISHLDRDGRWYFGLDTGMSSEVIFATLSTYSKTYHVEKSNSVPQDSDDFGRCLRLVNLMEWQSRLVEVAAAYPETAWPAIIAAWDKLAAATPEDQTKMLREINK